MILSYQSYQHLTDTDFIVRRLVTALAAILVAVIVRVVLPHVRRGR